MLQLGSGVERLFDVVFKRLPGFEVVESREIVGGRDGKHHGLHDRFHRRSSRVF